MADPLVIVAELLAPAFASVAGAADGVLGRSLGEHTLFRAVGPHLQFVLLRRGAERERRGSA